MVFAQSLQLYFIGQPYGIRPKSTIVFYNDNHMVFVQSLQLYFIGQPYGIRPKSTIISNFNITFDRRVN